MKIEIKILIKKEIDERFSVSISVKFAIWSTVTQISKSDFSDNNRKVYRLLLRMTFVAFEFTTFQKLNDSTVNYRSSA